MIDILTINQILIWLAVKYPGGAEQFKIDGGSITAIPSSEDLVITHPNLPKEIADVFKEKNFILQRIPNFNNVSPEVKKDVLLKIRNDLNKINCEINISETIGVLIITAKTTTKSTYFTEISRIIDNYSHFLSLIALIYKDEYILFKGDLWVDYETIPEDKLKKEINNLLGDINEDRDN